MIPLRFPPKPCRGTGGHPAAVRRGWLVAVAAVLAGHPVPAARALDFHLDKVAVAEDGYTHDRAYLKYDDHTEIMIDPPRGWNTADTAASLTMTPDLPNSQVRLEKSPFTPDVPFKDAGLDAYRRRVLAGVPAGALNTRVSEEKANPLPFFHWVDFEFTVDYDLFGANLRRSAVFINLNAKEQILATVVSERRTFGDVHEAAMGVLRSWHPVPTH